MFLFEQMVVSFEIQIDFAVIGVSAIYEDGSLLDYDFREVRVAQAIIANARHVILVADSMKLERNAPIRIGHISEISTLVTDIPLPTRLQEICTKSSIAVLIAKPE